MIIDSIFQTLGGDKNPFHGVTYARSAGNRYDLLQTPDLWGKNPADNSYWQVGNPGKVLTDAIEETIAGATRTVDISTLFPLPDGDFLKAISNGLQRLSRAGRVVTVRVLAGLATDPRSPVISPVAAMTAWLKALAPPPGIPVYIGVSQSAFSSWNHSKLVIADGAVAIAGGHNQWTTAYCRFAPVHDVSVRLTGPAAADGVRFLNAQWRKVASLSRTQSPLDRYWTMLAFNGEVLPNAMLAALEPKPAPGSGGAKVLSLGKLGRGLVAALADALDSALDGSPDGAPDSPAIGALADLLEAPDPSADASRTARIAAMRLAKRTIRLSQQDLGVYEVVTDQWDEGFMDALIDAMVRKVDVYVVISDSNATDGAGEGYSFKLGVQGTAKGIKKRFAARTGLQGQALYEELARRVHIGPVRFTDRRAPPPDAPWRWRWEERVIEPANHAKVYIIDDDAFYVGSDNIYPILFNEDGLQEFGFLIEGAEETQRLLRDYWNKLWTYSSQWEVTDWSKV